MAIPGSIDTSVQFPFHCENETQSGLQVAVAKHLGLQTLGLADSIILPLNTTHYSLELEAYLDK